ncbi:hypothetical protein ACIOKD_34900 [Streptomyces sp. NPDC087844]|uniref:hypothetical protein n=1 Tax=Streptomyces sp. NPDC087844 TaxID=3365805 RepID=UPI003808455B
MIAPVGHTEPTARDSAGGGKGTAARPDKPFPPPPRMRDLDFLLGSFTCVYTPPGQQEEKVVLTSTKRALSGHYYDSLTTIPADNLHSRQIFGWNPADGKYVMQFHDDWGSSGTAESPTPQDGALKFSGSYLLIEAPSADGTAKGNRATVDDEITPLDGDRYRDVQTLTFSNGFTFQLTYLCRRSKAGHGE